MAGEGSGGDHPRSLFFLPSCAVGSSRQPPLSCCTRGGLGSTLCVPWPTSSSIALPMELGAATLTALKSSILFQKSKSRAVSGRSLPPGLCTKLSFRTWGSWPSPKVKDTSASLRPLQHTGPSWLLQSSVYAVVVHLHSAWLQRLLGVPGHGPDSTSQGQ